MRDEIKNKLNTSNLKQIDLEGMNITDDELDEITDAIIKKNPQVEDVFLNNNQIGDKGAKTIGEKFSNLSNLSHINLQFNHIDKEGAHGVFSLKREHPDLTIAFHGNKVVNTVEMAKIEEQYERPAGTQMKV